MSTAILISGQMRAAEVCAASILKAFHPAASNSNVQQPMVERDKYHNQLKRDCHGIQQVLQQLFGLNKVWVLIAPTRVAMTGWFDAVLTSNSRQILSQRQIGPNTY